MGQGDNDWTLMTYMHLTGQSHTKCCFGIKLSPLCQLPLCPALFALCANQTHLQRRYEVWHRRPFLPVLEQALHTEQQQAGQDDSCAVTVQVRGRHVQVFCSRCCREPADAGTTTRCCLLQPPPTPHAPTWAVSATKGRGAEDGKCGNWALGRYDPSAALTLCVVARQQYSGQATPEGQSNSARVASAPHPHTKLVPHQASQPCTTRPATRPYGQSLYCLLLTTRLTHQGVLPW
jgi:hypothetical protein